MIIKENESDKIARWMVEVEDKSTHLKWYAGMTLIYAGVVTNNVIKNWHECWEYAIVIYMIVWLVKQYKKLKQLKVRIKYTDIWNGETVK